jgi:ketosteroid isomerase-like protein
MHDKSLASAVLHIDQNNRRFEASYAAGDFVQAVSEFYTPDIRYLTASLNILVGRQSVVEFFETLSKRITAVYVHPVESFGDPSGDVVYQLCNTVQHLADGGRGYGHYVAVFRYSGDGWLCEMEAPALGWIGGGEPAA